MAPGGFERPGGEGTADVIGPDYNMVLRAGPEGLVRIRMSEEAPNQRPRNQMIVPAEACPRVLPHFSHLISSMVDEMGSCLTSTRALQPGQYFSGGPS